MSGHRCNFSGKNDSKYFTTAKLWQNLIGQTVNEYFCLISSVQIKDFNASEGLHLHAIDHGSNATRSIIHSSRNPVTFDLARNGEFHPSSRCGQLPRTRRQQWKVSHYATRVTPYGQPTTQCYAWCTCSTDIKRVGNRCLCIHTSVMKILRTG